MYKAILVDDERKICNLILELGEWERFGIQVAAVCSDGEEALDAIMALKPDLVLTDVHMPVYDGLELIRRASELGSEAVFIIISGYKYFEYAYNAFKYGVIDYLLKPIDEKQLNEVLDKTCKVLDQRRKIITAEDEIRRLNEHMELNIRRQMFEDLFEPGRPFPKTREELQNKYQKDFPKAAYQVLFLRTNRNLEESSSTLLVQKVRESVKRIFQPEEKRGDDGLPYCKICVETIHSGMGVLLNFNSGEQETVRRLIQSLFLDFREMAEMFGNTSVSLGVSSVKLSLEELPAAAQEARIAEAARMILGANRVLMLSEHRFSRLGRDHFLSEKDRMTFHNGLESLSLDNMDQWLQKLEERVDRQPPIGPAALLEIQSIMIQEARQCAAQLQLEEGIEEFCQEWQQETSQADGIRSYFEITRGLLHRLMEGWNSQKKRAEKLPIRLARAYIHEHYGEGVTLEEVAEQVGLSPAYFSTNFRKYEGCTFSEYLTSVRMDMAKELLSTTNMTNYEIASRVGYADDKYFTRVFKKEVGIRPGDYRKLYSR